MICPRCHAVALVVDVNGREECPACLFHPGRLRGVDLEAEDVPARETDDELRARHDAQVAEATEPGVIRHTRDVGPGQRIETVDWQSRCERADAAATEALAAARGSRHSQVRAWLGHFAGEMLAILRGDA